MLQMLKTRITNEVIGEYDHIILKWINKNRFEEDGHNMILGIENRNCEVYRVIEVTGFCDYVNVMEFICHLGLVDITDIPYAPKKGYDGRFRYVDLINLSSDGRRMVKRKH
jgi:hypothetical protein